ncbi:hypothetical protein EPN15_02295 [Patescibacteria group bacterium]|nr:MAG: hypothetical protein EPN15_02295 [Patescibacteria group bacterium]
MQKEVKLRHKYSLVLSFASMDELISFMEDVKRKDNELGIVGIEWIEKRALDKAFHLVERKEKKQREKSITLGSEKAFQSILEKFSNKEKGVLFEGGAK